MTAMSDVLKRRKTSKKTWSDLGDYARYAVAVEEDNHDLEAILALVAPAVREARAKLKPSWSRDAKDVIIPVFDALQKALVRAKNVNATGVHSLLKLPEYHVGDDAHSRARKLAKKHEALVEVAEAIKARLSKATIGDTDRVEVGLAGDW